MGVHSPARHMARISCGPAHHMTSISRGPVHHMAGVYNCIWSFDWSTYMILPHILQMSSWKVTKHCSSSAGGCVYNTRDFLLDVSAVSSRPRLLYSNPHPFVPQLIRLDDRTESRSRNPLLPRRQRVVSHHEQHVWSVSASYVTLANVALARYVSLTRSSISFFLVTVLARDTTCRVTCTWTLQSFRYTSRHTWPSIHANTYVNFVHLVTLRHRSHAHVHFHPFTALLACDMILPFTCNCTLQSARYTSRTWRDSTNETYSCTAKS